MKRSVCVVSLCLGVLASSAFAADVSIKGTATNTLQGSNNFFLSNVPLGTTFQALSAINIDVLARTPTTRYLLDANYSYYKYFGAGAAETSLTSGAPASATFSVDHTTQLAKYNAAASFSHVDLATTQLTQSGVVTARGFQDTYSASGGVTRDLSRLDSVTWSAQASTASFSDPAQTPYLDLSTSAAWNHKLSSTTTLTNSLNFDWFDANDPANSQRLFWQLMTGVQSQLSSRLTLSASIGETFVNSYQQNVAQPVIVPGVTTFQQQPGASHTTVGNIGLTYQLSKTTTASLLAAQAITPTVLGGLQNSQTVGLSINHNINSLANLSYSAQFAHTSSLGIPSDFFSTQVNYGYRLTREWRTNLSYVYRQRNDSTGLARSSTILASLAYDFTLMGNSSAIDKAEGERARVRERQSIGQVFPDLPSVIPSLTTPVSTAD